MKTETESCPKCGAESENFKNPNMDGNYCPIESRLTVDPKIFRALGCLRLGQQMAEDNRSRFSEIGESFTDRILIDYWDRQIADFKSAIEGIES